MITGIQLVEYLCSQGYYIEEQREFGIKDIGRSIKKLIPKIKNKIDETYANSPLGKWEIDRTENSINKSFKKRGELMRNISEKDGNKIFQNLELEERLIQKKPKESIIVRTSKDSNKNIDISSIENKNKVLESNISQNLKKSWTILIRLRIS